MGRVKKQEAYPKVRISRGGIEICLHVQFPTYLLLYLETTLSLNDPKKQSETNDHVFERKFFEYWLQVRKTDISLT